MEIEKILDQLLMPPPVLPISDSLKDVSGASLDRSHGSSTTNSSNSSWLSESSCGCHSPRAGMKKSNIKFYRKSILPPLLCGTTRSEMLSYKTKALEKEKRRQQNSRSKLITRVEAILSSVDVPETMPISSQESSPKIPLANSTACEETDSITVETSQLAVDENENLIKETEEIAETNTDHISHHDETNIQLTPEKSPMLKEQSDSPTSSSSSDSEAGFQNEAYRKSLQKLLQKSINSSLNDTFTMPDMTKPEPTISGSTSSTTTSSTTTENVWADNTQATVIQTNRSTKTDASSLASLSTSAGHNEKGRESPFGECSEADAVADSLVDSVLEEVRSEMTMYASFRLGPGSNNSERESVSNTPNPEDFLTSSSSKNVLDSIPKSESSKCSTECIDEALKTIGSQLVNSYEDNSVEKGKNQISHSSNESDQDDDLSSTHTEGSSFGEIGKDVSRMSSATPETAALISSYKNALESDEVPPSQLSEIADNSSVASEISQDKDVFDPENDAIINSTEVFSETDIAAEPEISEETAIAAKEKRQSEGRKRSNSYSTHAPSPLLVNSREEHTIYSTDADDGNCSEVANDTVFGRDVKRRLEMPSDSEDSTVSQPRNKAKDPNVPRKLSTGREEYRRKLEEQHKVELMELQRQHELQLRKLQEQLLQGNPQLVNSLGLVGGINLDQLLSSSCGEEAKLNPPLPCPIPVTHESGKMHLGWCKLSALVKGHLTRQLLGSRPVQSIMQTIRDTSRTILSMTSEELGAQTNMKTMQDATLFDRLFLQLRASMYEFHATFFDTTLQERLKIISQSREMDRNELLGSQEQRQGHRLSSATLKALQRKQSERRNRKSTLSGNNSRDLKATGHRPTKEIKSKISYLWKTGAKTSSARQPAKHDEKKKKGNKSPYGTAKSLVAVHRSGTMTPSIR